jgi:hypothetical protein
MFERAHHRRIHAVLCDMDPDFLRSAGCCFAGGTCLALQLGEYRESVDIDFLCASTAGYRAIRSTVSEASLGELFRVTPRLLREVRADRYGIRTAVDVEGVPIRFEVVLEGRIPICCEAVAPCPCRSSAAPICSPRSSWPTATAGPTAAPSPAMPWTSW